MSNSDSSEDCELQLSSCFVKMSDYCSTISAETSDHVASPYGKRLRNRSTIQKPKRYSADENMDNGQTIYYISSDDIESPEVTENMHPEKKKLKVEEDDDSDIENKLKVQEEDNDSDIENNTPVEKNDYESLIQRNIRDKMLFLQSLNLPEARKNLQQSLQKPKRQSKGLGSKTALKSESPVLSEPRRSSNRLLRLEPDGVPVKDLPKVKYYPDPNSSDIYKMRARMPVGKALGLKQTCRESDFDTIEQFLNGLSADLAPSEQPAILYESKTFGEMKNTEDLVAKVVPDRIYSLAVHPGITSRRLVAAGGRTGYLGLWDVESKEGEDGVFLFRPCHDSINCLSFESESLILASYEGTLKKLCLRTGEFDHLFATPDNVALRCTFFDALTDQCYIVSLNDGNVVTVDPRTSGINSELEMECHEKPIKTVSIHPMRKDYFLTASNDGTVRLWDLRNHKAMKPVAEISQKRSINCAYFSPKTGNKFHTLAYDDTARVYDCTNLDSNIKQTISVRHDNQVGRWVTPFRGQWLPNNDGLFAAGSKDQPRSILVFNASSGQKVHCFKSDYLQSIVSIITFHPTIPFMASGNSSGKVYIFK